MRKFRAIPGKGIFASEDTDFYGEEYEYNGKIFNYSQMMEIQTGIRHGVDVDIYADPKYDWRQMQEIRRGLEVNLDISQYADPKYSGEQMSEIRKQLEDEAFFNHSDDVLAAEDTKRDIMELPTSERADLLRQFWDSDKDLEHGHTQSQYFDWLERNGWDVSNYSDDWYRVDWETAADSDDNYEADYEEEYEIETREDAARWLNEKQNEYGSTYFFPAEERAKLDKLVEKFGNTYFWYR